MLLLYFFLFLLLSLGVAFLIVPIAGSRGLVAEYKVGAILAVSMAIMSLGLYQIISDQTALQQWLKTGATHYQLLEQVNQLGGITGMIERVKKRLAIDPNDAAGWLILGKLYLTQQNDAAAKEAINKAHELKPNDPEINRLRQALEK